MKKLGLLLIGLICLGWKVRHIEPEIPLQSGSPASLVITAPALVPDGVPREID